MKNCIIPSRDDFPLPIRDPASRRVDAVRDLNLFKAKTHLSPSTMASCARIDFEQSKFPFSFNLFVFSSTNWKSDKKVDLNFSAKALNDVVPQRYFRLDFSLPDCKLL